MGWFQKPCVAPLGDMRVSAGGVYCRKCANDVVEIAQVLAVTADRYGIPHVRYAAHTNLPDATDEFRTLALSVFAARFHEAKPH